MEKITVLVDLGNSETRSYVIYDSKTWYKATSNKYIALDAPVPVDYINEQTCSFVYEGNSYAQGRYVLREFKTRAQRPNTVEGKTEQLTTYLALNVVFINAVRLVAAQKECTVDELGDIEFNVGVLLPPAEHSKSSERIKAEISKINVIRCLTPMEFTKNVSITSVIVVPESAAAFMAALYELKDGQMRLRENNASYVKGDIVVLDIGAGTTDIVHIKDSDLILASKETMRKGGRNIESACKKALEDMYSYPPSDEDIQDVLKTGYLMQGSTAHDVVHVLNKEKNSFSSNLYNFLMQYLERNDLEIRAVKGVLVIGGGALETKRDGVVISPKIAESLIEYIKKVAPTVELVDIGASDPRRMNIEGLRLYYVVSTMQGNNN